MISPEAPLRPSKPENAESGRLPEQSAENPAEAVSRNISGAESARSAAESVAGEARQQAKGLGARLSGYLDSLKGFAQGSQGQRLMEVAGQASVAAEGRLASALSETYPRLQRADWNYCGRMARGIDSLRSRLVDLDNRFGRTSGDLSWLDGAATAARTYGEHLGKVPSRRNDGDSSRRAFLSAMSDLAGTVLGVRGRQRNAAEPGVDTPKAPRELPITVVREWVTEEPRAVAHVRSADPIDAMQNSLFGIGVRGTSPSTASAGERQPHATSGVQAVERAHPPSGTEAESESTLTGRTPARLEHPAEAERDGYAGLSPKERFSRMFGDRLAPEGGSGAEEQDYLRSHSAGELAAEAQTERSRFLSGLKGEDLHAAIGYWDGTANRPETQAGRMARTSDWREAL